MTARLAQLGKQVLVGSGAVGTVLRRKEVLAGIPVELLNIRRPEAVMALHEAYRNAGSRILVTNTFAANRLFLEEAGAADRCREIN